MSNAKSLHKVVAVDWCTVAHKIVDVYVGLLHLVVPLKTKENCIKRLFRAIELRFAMNDWYISKTYFPLSVQSVLFLFRK